ncbi:MAG: SDR family oxidoreductase [Deltaproteobacteria bacterium]|nr:SDR family oxidoreductase [Deltaproteobacteria bacterium]
MSSDKTEPLFSIKDMVIAITGAAGVLGSDLCRSLASRGAKLAVLDIQAGAAQKVAAAIDLAGNQAIAIETDVLSQASVSNALKTILDSYGRVDALINGAGGNQAAATTSKERTFFDLSTESIRNVFDINFIGTLLPCQVFGRFMADSNKGTIINISSMNAFRPLTRIPAYSAAKAAVSNLTQWLAVHMAQEYSDQIRVNAIAPGFFLTNQNRFLLTDQQTGKLTARGETILAHTPSGRFGAPEDLLGTVTWLLSDSSKFVNGIVVPIDGGFSAFSGV